MLIETEAHLTAAECGTPFGLTRLAAATITSPVGPLRLVASERGLAAVLWDNDRPNRVKLAAADPATDHPILRRAANQLAEYFSGERQAFDVPLDMAGTPFQRSVWAELRKIPFGETRSYGGLAAAIGAPKASRAVGAANGRNPVSIIVPCHRAIGADGTLTGFAGGLDRKRFLLTLEQGQRSLA